MNRKMKRKGLIFFVLLLLIRKTIEQTEEVRRRLSSVIKESLNDLGRNASKPQPKFGLRSHIDPLQAIAPLHYVHEGEFLRLRLELRNATLEGLSSLVTQEVSLAFLDCVSLSKEPNSHSSSGHLNPNSHTLSKGEDQVPHSYADEPLMISNYDEYHYDIPIEYDEFDISSSSPSSGHKNENVHTFGDYEIPFSQPHERNWSNRSTGCALWHNWYNPPVDVSLKFSRIKELENIDRDRRHSKRLSTSKYFATREESKSTIHNYAIVKRQSQPESDAMMSLSAKVRVSFSKLKIKAQYVIKGKAGGVLSFKEQGNLVFSIPNIFLTSEFNVTLILAGTNGHQIKRGNQISVNKIRSNLGLDIPTLKLIPKSRPPEWVRKQLQEKMEQLGRGLGKRDGAVRFLLRHWARILRRIFTKAFLEYSPPLRQS